MNTNIPCCALDLGARDTMITKTGMVFALIEFIVEKGRL